MTIQGLDHIQLAMPPGGEPQARTFYGALLQLDELRKPEPLAQRGGCWFAAPGTQLHLGVEQEFNPARKAHPALLVDDLDALRERLQAAGVTTADDDAPLGRRRFHAFDPFGNRIEFMQMGDGFSQR